LLIIDDKPLVLTKLDQYTVRFTLPRPYAAAERIFDGLAMLPKHLLEKAYRRESSPDLATEYAIIRNRRLGPVSG